MDFVSLLTAISASISTSLAYYWLVTARRSQEETEEALEAAREPKVDQALMQGDLKGLGDYFFNTLGRLPLADYADDNEARGVVSDAVRNVESFVDPDRHSAWGEADVLSRVDAQRVEADIAAGDFWGGLSRLRRRIELSLRAAAAEAGIHVDRLGGGQLLHRLVREEVVAPEAAAALREALQICNRGVHGEAVTGEEVERALLRAAEGLGSIGMTDG